MDKIARIRQEIERLKKYYAECGYPGMGEYEQGNKQGRLDTLDSLLSFLDTLSEEPDKGLDVTNFCKPIDPSIAQCVADHWWEMLGEVDKHPKNILPPSKECDHGLREPLESEEPDKSLEEEIRRYKEHYIKVKECGFSFDLMDIESTARHFAEWGVKHLK